MGLGTSLLLIAVGAILKFAVDVQSDNVDLETIGVILMLVGAAGAVLSMIFWNSWGGFNSSSRRTTTVYDQGAPAAPVDGQRRVVQEEYRNDVI